MIRETALYRAFFGLTLPLALQNLLTFGVNLMDTVMLGPRYWGKSRLEPVPRIIGAALRFGGALPALLFTVGTSGQTACDTGIVRGGGTPPSAPR